jgi:uncharacterized protein YbaR (Trm112 family)
MPDKPTPPLTFNPAIAADLACPACFGDLHVEVMRLVCAACHRAYPIVDGIPVLIVERAQAADKPR